MGTDHTDPWLVVRKGEPDDDELAAVVAALLAVRGPSSPVTLHREPGRSPWTTAHRYRSPRSWADV